MIRSKSAEDYVAERARKLRSHTSDRVRYFFLNPEIQGAGKYLRRHKEQVRVLLLETLRMFSLATMHPPESCEQTQSWEDQIDWLQDVGLLVFDLEEFDGIWDEAFNDVWYGAVEHFNQHPDKENAKEFFELNPEFFGNKKPTQEQIASAANRANARWEQSELCEEDSPRRAAMRRMREDQALGLGPMPSGQQPDNPNELP